MAQLSELCVPVNRVTFALSAPLPNTHIYEHTLALSHPTCSVHNHTHTHTADQHHYPSHTHTHTHTGEGSTLSVTNRHQDQKASNTSS